MGLAISIGKLAEPLAVLRIESWGKFMERLLEIAKDEKVEKIVIGISEGKMGEETEEFSEKLKKEIKVPIILFDETLSTYQAKKLSQEAGIKRKKRNLLEDAFAASVMLNNYLERIH